MHNKLDEILVVDNFQLINFISLSKEEVELVRSWRNSESIRSMMIDDRIINPDEHERFVEGLRRTKRKIYWFVRKDNNNLGVLSFTDISWEHGRTFLGLYVNPDIQGRGFGKELLRVSLKLAFEIFDFHTIKIQVLENNERALKLYEKFKFQFEGRLREYIFRDGRWLDVIIMGIINPRHKGMKNEDTNQR
jgi:UDP-4-amino-4,6-dideoxy-N-acetyl-beta-L-altrosamine N-acetyltransferase